MENKPEIDELRRLAEWFENPDDSPYIDTPYGKPWILLRAIADELEKKSENMNEDD